jgi:signal transduction histidine kinase
LLAKQAPGICEIQQAAHGAAGLAMMRANKFDCVLLDFNLPDMTGLEFLAGAAVDGALPCAIVLVTGQGNEAIAVEAMKCGVQDYMVKDQVNANNLWRAMTTAVTQTELRQHLANSLRELTTANTALEQEISTRKAVEIELRAAKDAAEQANQARTRFVAMVTHELRTPLNGILGYAQLLRIEEGLSVRQDAHVGAMMQAGRHLLEMIERVLDFASIDSGRMELHPVPLRIHDLIEDCIAFIGPIATQRALSLRMVSTHDAPQMIAADPARLRQVLLNLLGNAVKFTQAGSVELRLLAGAKRGGVRIEVVDTGPGIPDADRERLFQDFERLDAATSMEGAGLGLAIAARIVGLMGGSIGYTPNPSSGSVFWLELPPTDIALPPPSSSALMTATPAASGRLVLLVDDIAMNRDVIGAFLRAAGHAVVLAESGQDAVRLALERAFDLILMDVRMPEMDGLEATRRIRTLPAPHGQIPILALTAYAFPDQVMQCREAGMDGHIAKPVDYTTLIQAINDTIACATPCWVQDSSPPNLAEAREQPSLRLDRVVLDRMLAFLPPDEVAGNLNLLRVRKEQMLWQLQQPAAPAQIRDTAHVLASAAGMFGFMALSVVARSFEHAMMHNEPEVDHLAQQLRTETHVALVMLDELIGETRMQPV